MDPSKYTALFLSESREHLQQCNTHLLTWERDPGATAPVQGLFRAVHTLKGMAAAMGYARLAELAHAFENMLAAVREGAMRPSPRLIAIAFDAVDLMERGMEDAVAGRDAGLDVEPIRKRLERASRSAKQAPGRAARGGGGRAQRGSDADEGGVASVERAGVLVRVRLRPGTPLPGARAALVLRRAEGLGPVSAVTPPPAQWMTESFDGGFSFRVAAPGAEDEIRRALLEIGEVAEVLTDEAVQAAKTASRPVRVEQSRLDALVALTSELVVARNRLAALIERRGDPELESVCERLVGLVSDVQDHVLRTRMAPIAEVFDRFPRAVRDLARQLDKRVRLDVEGADIELDRTILDGLADPLLHLVRNAVDHGIEGPAEREAAGKAAEGRIRLRAYRERNAVLVEVEDDGRGVNRAAVVARAREAGWMRGAEGSDGAKERAEIGELGDEELLRVLARPGFSTARQVTGVSGRGVGFDAVVHWVRSMGGATAIASRPGAGTTVTLRLPLTVAIVPALLVGVGDQRYAVPLSFVAETTRIRMGAGGAGGAEAVEGPPGASFRGKRVPVIELVVSSYSGNGWRPGVILDVAGRQSALAVDTLLGQEDIVIGPLVAPRGTPRWVNGATILADGRAALVVDPAALV